MSNSVTHVSQIVQVPDEELPEDAAGHSGPAAGAAVNRLTSRRAAIVGIVVIAVMLMIGLRSYRLESDPYPWLDWSAGLLTDEGFYIHNARNVAVYGHPRTDEFNNMLLSPLLHFAQVGVFHLLGAGSVQARLISVACSLLTLIVFYAAMRRGFGTRVAATATAFLGLDHTNLLFNRMALMDTPAALPAVLAFYAFVRATTAEDGRWTMDDGAVPSIPPATESDSESRNGLPSIVHRASSIVYRPPSIIHPQLAWFFICGAFLGLTFVSRSLCAYLLPAPFLAIALSISGPITFREKMWRCRRQFKSILAGLVVVIVIYAAVWYLPNRREIMAMNHHYLTKQILPESFGHLIQNLQHSVFGDTRGIAPYLFRHTPALLLLAVLGIAFLRTGSEKGRNESGRVGEWETGRAPVTKSGGKDAGSSDSGFEEPHLATLSPCHPVTLSPCHPVTQSPSHPVTLSPSHPLSLSPPLQIYLASWLLAGWLMLSVISYSPHRYYVSTYPAFAALAGLSLWRLPELWTSFWASTRRARVIRGVATWLIVYHLIETLIHHDGVLPDFATEVELYAPATILAWMAARFTARRVRAESSQFKQDGTAVYLKSNQPGISGVRQSWLIPAAICLWVAVNALWTGLWLGSIDDSLIRTSRWLGRVLPPNSVLIGDPAPGVCMDNNFKAILVIKGLCNGTEPVERFEGSPRFIVVVRDSPVKKLYWNKYYPNLLTSRRKIASARTLRWDVEFYAVDLLPERHSRL